MIFGESHNSSMKLTPFDRACVCDLKQYIFNAEMTSVSQYRGFEINKIYKSFFLIQNFSQSDGQLIIECVSGRCCEIFKFFWLMI